MSEICQRPLNPVLYRGLCARLGPVIVANEGQSTVSLGGLSGKRVIISSGEFYRTNCIFCGDSRHRLWFNHVFGVPNQRGFPDTSLVHCFNQECTRNNPTRRNQLYERTFGFRNRNQRPVPMPILRGETAPTTLVPAAPPGEILPLTSLPKDHQAIAFVRNRGYLPEYLQNYFEIGYCPYAPAPFGPATDRLYIPLKMNGELVGWQCRSLLTHSNENLPKYFGMRGMAKNRLLYNFDVAKQWPFVVVVEGATDVWRIGAPAVAILGKSLSGAQQQLLQSTWPGRPIVVALDGEAIIESEGIVADLNRYRRNPIVSVALPHRRDPDSFTTEEIWRLIHAAANSKGISLFETPPQ